MNEEVTMNKLGTAKVNRLMLSMGIPMILSMMLQAVYNIVDSAFVSNMPGNGEMALNALTLAFPVQMLMVAVGIGTGVGTNALLSKSIGQGNYEKASRVAGNSMFLAIIIYLVFALFGIFGTEFYASSQTSNPEIKEMVVQYLQICCIASFGIVFFSIFEKLLQATGHSMYSTIAQITGAVANIILDPILIYGLFGLPAMGVAGAAYATIIGQIASTVLGLIFHLKKNKEISNGLALIEALAVPFSALFGLSGETQDICISAMRIISLSFVFAGINIAYQGIFQALDSGLESLIISVLRQFLFVLPVAWGFSLLAIRSNDMIWTVWITFIIAEVLSCIIATIFMSRINRKIISELEG